VASPEPIRVMLADDHLVFRFGLSTIVDRQPDMCVVGEAWSAPSAVALYRAQRPDVTLMDLCMPGDLDTENGGLEAIRVIRAEDPQARIVVVTIHSGDLVRQARAGGAAAILAKDAPCDDVLAAIRAVHADGGSIVTAGR